jgi:AAHS family 4-hydroxybenzoate transporter-like MFS transporter
MSGREVNVSELVDEGRLGPFQLLAFGLLGLSLAMDGFDVQAIGYVAPAIVRDWGVENAAMGPVFGAGLAGLFLGSIAFSVLADRIGRRPVLLLATLVFAGFTLATAWAASIPALAAARFAAGLGLGAMMPNATALVGEYSPRRHRVATMMIVTNGFMVGAVAGGFLSAWLVPRFGWRSVFVVGGAVPLALLGPMAAWLPESLQFLVLRGRPRAELARWVRRLAPAAPAGEAVRYVVREEHRAGPSLRRLFAGGRGAGTALLWIANFTNVLDAYFVSSWLPTVVRDHGHDTATAVLVGTAVQVGGMLGTVALGLVVQRLGFAPVLTTCFAVAALNLAILASPALALGPLVAVAFVVGFGVLGGQPGLNALAATFYPTELRSTGIGVALGVGRFGAILGPLVAGALMARQWAHEEIFRAAAVPALVSAVAVLAMSRAMGRARRGAGAAAADRG